MGNIMGAVWAFMGSLCIYALFDDARISHQDVNAVLLILSFLIAIFGLYVLLKKD